MPSKMKHQLVKYKNQDYNKLCKFYASVLNSKFSDPLFPPSPSSIGIENELDIKWRRPNELCENPRLVAERFSTTSVLPGTLSCEWMVSALSVVGSVGELCRKIIPDFQNQEWDPEEEYHSGIFKFKFWQFGQWVEVVIDDFLPTVNDKLLFTHSSTENEFWVPLVEKAYAKLHGSYGALEGGHLSDALVDFTGGVCETLDLRNFCEQEDKRVALYETLSEEIKDHALICVIVTPSSPEDVGVRNTVGLCQGQVYSVTSVKKIRLTETSLRNLFSGREKFSMVRVRDVQRGNIKPRPLEKRPGKLAQAQNRRGSQSRSPRLRRLQCLAATALLGTKRVNVLSAFFKGIVSAEEDEPQYVYSATSLMKLLSKNVEWSSISESQRERLGLTLDHEGEFWMPLEDFVNHFHEMTICRLFNTNMFALSKSWCEVAVRGEWLTGAKGTPSDRSGGGPSNSETYLRNPQYMFDIKKQEEEIVIQMLQISPSVEIQSHLIGFIVIKVEDNRKYRLHVQWNFLPTVISVDHIRKRELFYSGALSHGRYVLIPSTHKQGETGEHLVRIFSGSDINLRVLKRDVPSSNIFTWCLRSPVYATVINIKGAENVGDSDDCNSFCIIICEGKKGRTPIAKNTANPYWNSSFIFYRCKPNLPVVIKVYDHHALRRNKFLGQVRIPAGLNYEPTLLHVELMGKGKTAESPTQGTLALYVLTEDNFMLV